MEALVQAADVSSWIPAPDVVGPASAESAQHPIVSAVGTVCDELLGPTAEQSDREGVPRSHLDVLASAGAMGIQFPTEDGAPAAPTGVVREVVERIAGACGTTWFCYAQHKTPLGILLQSTNDELRAQWVSPLRSGQALGSAAFAHLRRPKQKFFATEMTGGWKLDGKLDWVTSWPISDVAVVQAAVVDEQGLPRDVVVSAFVEVPHPEAVRAPGLSAGPPLELAAMGGTHTWPVRFGGYRVKSAHVALVETRDEWLQKNARFSADANPASFGMARAAVNELAQVGERTGQRAVTGTAMELAKEIRDLRASAYTLADAAAADTTVADASEIERTEIRARALDLNVRAANALVTACGGSAMSLWVSPQRRAREAIFLLVQGQTAQLRDATLRRTARAASIEA